MAFIHPGGISDLCQEYLILVSLSFLIRPKLPNILKSQLNPSGCGCPQGQWLSPELLIEVLLSANVKLGESLYAENFRAEIP